MIAIPRLQEFACGLSLRIGSYIILIVTLVAGFFGLIIVTSLRLEEDKEKQNGNTLDMQYILNTVVSIITFLFAPLALYGTYKERAPFILPFLSMLGIGTILLGFDFVTELFGVGDESGSASVLLFLIGAIIALAYSMLVIFSYYNVLKEQRQEIE